MEIVVGTQVIGHDIDLHALHHLGKPLLGFQPNTFEVATPPLATPSSHCSCCCAQLHGWSNSINRIKHVLGNSRILVHGLIQFPWSTGGGTRFEVVCMPKLFI